MSPPTLAKSPKKHLALFKVQRDACQRWIWSNQSKSRFSINDVFWLLHVFWLSDFSDPSSVNYNLLVPRFREYKILHMTIWSGVPNALTAPSREQLWNPNPKFSEMSFMKSNLEVSITSIDIKHQYNSCLHL